MKRNLLLRWRGGAALALAGLLAGCASLSPDGAQGPVRELTRQRLGQDVQWARTDDDRRALAQRVQELLKQPLTADQAVQVALLNNRGLQADLAELGITEAEQVQASRLPNPGFSFARLRRGDEVELERGFHFNLAKLIALPLVRDMATQRLVQAQGRASSAVFRLAADTRKAWIQAVAAQESLVYRRQVQQTAQASAELAKRMQQVGNFNKLQRAREQLFYADASLNLARAEQAQRASREQLIRLLGLWGDQTAFQLPQRLPELPGELVDQPRIEQAAMGQRLDILAAQQDAQQTARNLGLTRSTRFINVLELGALNNTSNEVPRQRGWEVSVELPLFDWGDARVARAEAVYGQALDRAAHTAINARSQVREAYGAWRSAYDIARHQRDELVPLRQMIQEENVLRYNGMLIGVFELLADARLQIESVNSYLDALRDFWVAQADLDLAMIGSPSLGTVRNSAGSTPMPSSTPDAGGAGH
jgi:outer membrane protein TolC